MTANSRRRADIRAAHVARLSESWICPGCLKTVQFIVTNGFARCPKCTYYRRRDQFDFQVLDDPWDEA